MRRAKLFLVAVLILGALGGAWLSSFSQPFHLIRLEKTGPAVWGILSRFELDVAQELETLFLVRADADDLTALRREGFRFTVLDRGAERKDYYLVAARSAEERDFLSASGRSVLLEGETWLYGGPRGEPSPPLPATMPLKPLAATSLLPYLHRPSSIPVTAATAPSRNGTIDLIVAGVNGGSIKSFVEGLQSYQTRYATTANCDAAAESIYQFFQGLGLRASYAPFTFRTTYSSRNVIGEKPGLRQPEEVVIICGHYDSTSNQAATLAPGADDNASGVAAVMEAARLLSRFDFDFTVKFIAFGAEEFGLYGSADYASRARSAGERIVGVVNLDMIGYVDAVPEDLDLIVNPLSEWLAERLKLAAGSYAGLTSRKIVTASANYSDHAPFWDRGYPALLAIEDQPLHNPYYHKTTDTADKLNDAFFVASTRASLAVLAELAQPSDPALPKTPVGLEGRVGTYSALFSAVRALRLTWTADPSAAGYNIYRSLTSHLNYQKLNSVPLTGTSFTERLLDPALDYYYVITAVGSGGGESNFSREIWVVADTTGFWAGGQR